MIQTRRCTLPVRGPKKMRMAMSRHGLMATRKRPRVRTTFPVPVDAANLCRVPRTAGELLVSDFTYVPLDRGFAYFAITLDVFTRRVRGWAVSKTMSSDFAVQALHMALESGPLAPGWVHHSDRGCQYACAEFRNLVRNFHGISSFSRPATPSDNPFAESFFARFKDEVLHIQWVTPQSFAAIRRSEATGSWGRRGHDSIAHPQGGPGCFWR